MRHTLFMQANTRKQFTQEPVTTTTKKIKPNFKIRGQSEKYQKKKARFKCFVINFNLHYLRANFSPSDGNLANAERLLKND